MYTRRQVLEAAMAIAPLSQVRINSPDARDSTPPAQNKTYSFKVYPPEAEELSKYHLPPGFNMDGDARKIRADYQQLRRLDIIPDVGPAHAVLEQLIADLHSNPQLLASRFAVSEPESSGETVTLYYGRRQDGERKRTYTNLGFLARLRTDGQAELINLDGYSVHAKRWTDKYRAVERNASLNREEWHNHVTDLESAGSIDGRHATILPISESDNQSFREVDMDGFRGRLEEAIRTQTLKFTPGWKPIGQKIAHRID